MESSIEQVMAIYSPTVYGVALTHTANRADADDVFQEVFVAYWRSRPSLASEEHRKAWLIRTTLNLSLKITQSSWAKKMVYADGERESRPDGSFGSTVGETAVQSAAQATAKITAQTTAEVTARIALEARTEIPLVDFTFQTKQQSALYAAIGKLSVAYRTVVLLFYFEDMSIAQIAEVLGEGQGTVKTRLSRARAQLREMLKEGVRND